MSPNFQIFPITLDDAPALAAFLARSVDQLRRDSGLPSQDLEEASTRQANGLKSRLGTNPFAEPDLPVGWMLRNEAGTIAGMLVCYPWRYCLGDRRLKALAGGPFFVAPEARMNGFFLFRRFVNTRGVDFAYATTCNQNSGSLWQTCGAVVLPDSVHEYMFLYRAEGIVQELLLRRGSPALFAKAARLAGSVLRPILLRGRSGLKISESRDWGQLAEFAERWRPSELLTCDRTPEYLRWSYETRVESGNVRLHIVRFPNGKEGWFALEKSIRGRAGQIRGMRLLDAVWPREHYGFDTLLTAVHEVASVDSDLLSVRPRPGFKLVGRPPALLNRTLPAPESFLLSKTENASQLSTIADFAYADAV